MQHKIIHLQMHLLFISQGYLIFLFCFTRPRTPSKREWSKQFEPRGVTANTGCLNHKAVRLGRALQRITIQLSPFKMKQDSPKDTQPATETAHTKSPLTPLSLTSRHQGSFKHLQAGPCSPNLTGRWARKMESYKATWIAKLRPLSVC